MTGFEHRGTLEHVGRLFKIDGSGEPSADRLLHAEGGVDQPLL